MISFHIETRMYSSRMRTVRCSGYLVGPAQGGVWLGGVCLGGCLPGGGVWPGGMSVQKGGVYLGGGVHHPPSVDRILDTRL